MLIQFSITLLSILALLGDDLRIIFLPKSLDVVFDVFMIVLFVGFTGEILLLVKVEKSYYKSAYFFLDIFCTFLMLLDVSFIYFPIADKIG